LGLTLSRAIARQHGGDLKLANAEGGGCLAELVIPTVPA
jgi:two-component system, NtrC family, sensor histidine kinase HydH